MTDMSRTFAEYALSASAFDAGAMKAAKTFILDSLGVGIAGSRAPFGDAVYAAVQNWGGGGGASLWGRGQCAPAASAAYLNGFQIHSMEYDCVHEPAVVHPMATIFAALSAEAESRGGISGQALIEAVIVAVDIAVELGVAAKSGLKFFRPATAGLFGATLGIARLRGFDTDTALSAMGCALAQCAGVMQAHVEGKPTLPVQIAGAARAAIVACDLAQAGLAGPVHALEGPYGYFAMFEDKSDPAGAAAKLGKIHRITEVSWKPFPTGRAAQGGICLVQELRAQGLTLDNLESLTLSAPPIIPRLVARPMVPGMTPNYARLCFAYLAAVTIERGSVGLEDFSTEDLSSDAFFAASQSIKTHDDGNPDPAAFVPQTATAVLKNGKTLTATTKKLFGSPAFPLTNEQHLAKFEACIAFGLRDIKARNAARGLISTIDSLQTMPDCAGIFTIARGTTGKR